MSFDLVNLHRQEAFLQRHPLLFRCKVLLWLLLGLLMFGSILMGSVLVLVLLILLLLSGKGFFLLLLKLNKLLVLLLLPLWAALRLSLRALFWRMPKPVGRPVSQEEAPALFEALKRIRQEMKGPRISRILLIDQMNAYALSRPLFGLWFLFYRQHYIALGVPLIQTLSEDEALAVLAHEYGHISGYPTRFDSFIYRLRHRLVELMQHIEQWQDWPSRLLGKLLAWYVPAFDKSTFALCRSAEYAADAVSQRLIGAAPCATALMRVRVAGNYVQQNFWPSIYNLVEEQADAQQVQPWSRMPSLVREHYNADLAADLLRDSLREETEALDTHPALRDRLNALQFDTQVYQQEGRSLPPVAERTAAESWFGERLPQVLRDFDQGWAESVSSYWQERHESLSKQRAYRAEIRSKSADSLTDEDAWVLLLEEIEKGQVSDPDARVWQFIQEHPKHAKSRVAWGRNNLQEDTSRAVQTLFEGMLLDPQLIEEAASSLWSFYALVDVSEKIIGYEADDPYRQSIVQTLLRQVQR